MDKAKIGSLVMVYWSRYLTLYAAIGNKKKKKVESSSFDELDFMLCYVCLVAGFATQVGSKVNGFENSSRPFEPT